MIEIGDTQSLPSLHRLASIYLSPQTSVQLYVAVKIYPRRPDGTFPLLVLLYNRNNPLVTTPTLAISCGSRPLNGNHVHPALIRPLLTGVGFGGPPCHQPGLQPYQLRLPIASVYWGTQPPPGIQSIDIDLFPLQQILFA